MARFDRCRARNHKVSKETRRLALHLDREIEQRLETLGATTDSKKTKLARNALLETLEDLVDLRVAEKRFAKEERIWNLEEIERGDDLES